MDKNHPDPYSLSREQLIDQNKKLQKNIQEMSFDRAAIWSVFVDVSRRLQISSASIKAAVTSLLNHDIFWDPSAQHEFLQTINQSVDDVSSLSTQISLASRIRVDKLVLKREPQMLQEILSVLEEDICHRLKNLDAKLVFPAEGNPVVVDYKYLMIALRILLEVVALTQKNKIQLEMRTSELENLWVIDIRNIPISIHRLFCDNASNISEEFILMEHIPAERVPAIYNAYNIFRLQEIELSSCEETAGIATLRFAIPVK